MITIPDCKSNCEGLFQDGCGPQSKAPYGIPNGRGTRIGYQAWRSFAILSVLLVLQSFLPDQSNRISLAMEAKFLKAGKVATIQADIYYDLVSGAMVSHYLKPTDYVFLSNPKGEAKVYYPSRNEVLIKQSLEFDTEKTMLYFFLNNKVSDLGLKDLGFTISGTRFEEGMTITTWKPPATLLGRFSKVELVHENYLPVYIAYFNPKGKTEKKIWYYNYEYLNQLALPGKVLECVYLSEKDSVLTRITYSQIKAGAGLSGSYFNYKIPSNARIIK